MIVENKVGLSKLTHRFSWEQWKERWESCTDSLMAFGLLQSIFEAHEGDYNPHGESPWRMEKILFLLDLADRYKKPRGGESPEMAIRTCAFNVLATRVFKHKSRADFRFLSSDVQRALVAFFRSSSNVRWDTPASDYTGHLASQYLQEFCSYVWENDKAAPELRAEVLELYYQHYSIEQLAVQCQFKQDNPWGLFSEDMVLKLEELALSGNSTLEEAVYRGDKAAKVLLIVRTALAEEARRPKSVPRVPGRW